MLNNNVLRRFNIPPIQLHRNMVWGLLVLGALVAFESFNYSTTEFAMRDMLGDLRFGGIGWATILALAFCSIDFAGIAFMFSNGRARQGLEIWYLFAAWLLAATMNATLTWWGVSIAIIQNGTLGNGILSREAILQVVPAFVAVLVWLIRVLIIGTLITAGKKFFNGNDAPVRSTPRPQNTYRPAPRPERRQPVPQAAFSNGNVAHSFNGNGQHEDRVVM
jgi:hypothetical protein